MIVALSDNSQWDVAASVTCYAVIQGYFPQDYLFHKSSERERYRKAFIQEAVAQPDSKNFVLTDGSALQGLVHVRKLDWDSEHYGAEIYALSAFFYPEVTAVRRQSAIADVLAQVRQQWNISQISVHLSADDKESEAALRALNFTARGQQQTLFVTSQTASLGRLRHGRAWAVREASLLPDQEADELACAIRFPSRLYQESLCQPELVAKMHGQWLRQMLARDPQDRAVWVFLREGMSVGLAACEKLALPDDCGDVRVFGRTLFGFLPNQAGCALDVLLRQGLLDALSKASVVESTVAESNRVVIRMLLRAGHRVARRNIVMTRTFL